MFGGLEFHGVSKVSFQDCKVLCWQVQDVTGDWGLGRTFQWRSVYLKTPVVNKSSRTFLLLKETRFMGAGKLLW